MANRQQRRSKRRGHGTNKMNIGLKYQLARDMTIDIAVNKSMQRAMWMTAVALNDMAGWGPKRIQKFVEAVESIADEWSKMAQEVDADYANEKLRMKAEQVSGLKIEYVEDQMRAKLKVQRTEGGEN